MFMSKSCSQSKIGHSLYRYEIPKRINRYYLWTSEELPVYVVLSET